MLKLHTSNRLETLAETLAETLRAPLSSPLRPELVMVQSQGMARWLKLQLAEAHGICANYGYPFPKIFCAELLAANADGRARSPLRAAESTVATRTELALAAPGAQGTARPTASVQPAPGREVMLWEVMRLLPEMLDQPEFAPLKNYLGDRRDARKRYQLAAQIANLFDQYLVFRPDLVLAWDQGTGGTRGTKPDGHEAWQAALWRRLWQDKPDPHLAAQWREFGIRARQPGFTPARMPERISVFGISALPPSYLQLLCALGAYAQVHLFLLQPSKEYWGQIVSARESDRILRAAKKRETAGEELHLEPGNRLLASVGKLGREFLELVLGAADWEQEETFTEPPQTNLLQNIQADIFHLRDRGRGSTPTHNLAEPSELSQSSATPSPALTGTLSPSDGERDGVRGLPLFSTQTRLQATESESSKLPVSEADTSVRVHSCHSPLREVEVLYDHLLEWFQLDPTLTPRDVLVMTPDIETYAPFIQAVFDAPEEPAKRIPFSVADRGVCASSPLITTFFALLRLPSTRLEATTVLRLLETETVRAKFSLSEADLDIIRSWVRRTNIRWGRDAKQRESLGLPALAENTWQQGMDRLLLGYAMAGRGEQMFNGVLPFDDVEGASAEVLGHFAEYLQRLFDAVAKLKTQRAVGEWEQVLLRVLDTFFQPPEAQVQELLPIRSALHDLAAQAAEAAYEEPVELAVILECLTQALEEDRFGAGFITGGVTFCALKPMRSIPFKVIGLIGMNDNAFPRSDRHLAFDLMARHPRLGDRSLRADDRYLFLETLLSARERLHISYVGQSIRDNSEAPPSVLVSELLDYVEQAYELACGAILKDHVLVRHRLQAFSRAYFTGEHARLFSYSAENCRASECGQGTRAAPKGFLDTPLSEPEADWRTVDVSDLAEFFCNPSRWLVTRRLKLRLDQREEALEDAEPFEVGALDGYGMKQELAGLGLKHIPLADGLRIMQAAGRLPLGEAGHVRFRELQSDVQAFLERLRPRLGAGYVEPVPVDQVLGDFRLTGQIARLTATGSLHYRCANIKARDLVRFWVQHVVLNTARPASRLLESVLVGSDQVLNCPPLSHAPEVVADLLKLYWQGLCQPLKFFPQTSWAFAESACKQESSGRKADPLSAASRAWGGNPYQGVRGESEDAYFDLCFRNTDPLDEQFQQMARAVFGPLLGALQEVEA